MKTRTALAAVLGLFILVTGPAAGQVPELTTASLLEDMVDLGRLARAFPEGTRVYQFSSYDRHTQIVDGRSVDWWANHDLGYYLREETTARGTEYVMAESEGPGVLVRIWSANPGNRVFRIYLDGSDQPVLEAAGKKLLGGEVPPWGPGFAQRRSLGANFIFPIPFARSIKVTASRPSGKSGVPPLMYYHVELRRYPAGTAVRSFALSDLTANAEAIERTESLLLAPDLLPVVGEEEEAEVSLAAGAEGELFKLTGPGAISRFEVEVNCDDITLRELLGQTLLLIYWDGQSEAAVAVPLGDFFGTSPGARNLSSLPASMTRTESGTVLVSRWVMPFQEEARIVLAAQGSRRIKLRARVWTRAWEWGADSMYFHAGWRELSGLPTRPFRDLDLLEVQGRGSFVGLELNVRNHLRYFWWGEGDEKIWVDDDSFPSIFGTGTEDYFGYAWCVQYLGFNHAYHGVSLPTREYLVIPQALPIPFFWEWLSRVSPGAAVVSQYRWQILDAIPFDRSFRFDLELYHHRETTVDVNAAVYWYSRPGSSSDAVAPGLGQREVWPTEPGQ